MVRVRPTTADLNCAIVPLPVGAGSDPTVMAGSASSTDQPGTVESSPIAKLGLTTMFSLSAHAASIWAWVAGTPNSRRRRLGSIGVREEAAGAASESVLIAPTVTVWTSVVVSTCTLVSTAVTVITKGAVGQMATETVLFREMVGVAEGSDEFPNDAEVVTLSDALGVTDGIFVKLLDVVTVRICIVVELPPGGILEMPVGAEAVVFEPRVTWMKIPELELGTVDVVEFIDMGGREDDAAPGRLAVELLEGVGTPKDDPKGCVNVLGGVLDVLAFTELGGMTTVAVRTTNVVLRGVGKVTLPISPVPDRVEFRPTDEERLKLPERRSSVLLKGGPVDVVLRLDVGVIVGGLVVDALDEGKMTPELPNNVTEDKPVDTLNWPERRSSVLLKEGPVVVEFRLGVGVILGGADIVEFEDGLMTPLLPPVPTTLVDSLKPPVRSPSEFVNGGPVNVKFMLGVGVTLGRVEMVELEEGLTIPLLPPVPTILVDSLKPPVRLPSEFVNGGPVDVKFMLGVGVTLGRVEMVELEEGSTIPLLPPVPTTLVDSLKPPVRSPSEFVNGGPVDVVLEVGTEVTAGGMMPLSLVETEPAVLN